jgi:AcrR family transcriptional regulator
MARPRNSDGQRTRQAILDAALDLFGERGFFGTSLRDVAGAVGVRESALYNYFPSKDALFEALITADQDVKLERLSAVLDAPAAGPRPILLRLASHMLADFALPRQQQVFRILMSDGFRLARVGRLNLAERMGGGRSRMREAMQSFVDRGWLRGADPEVLTMTFVGPLLLWRHMLAIEPGLPVIRDPEAFARQHVDHFLDGAAAPPRRPDASPADTRTSRTRRPAASPRPRSPRSRA